MPFDRVLIDKNQFFWLKDGRGLTSIIDLLETLPSISQLEFKYHVNKHKNDFANWIRGIFEEEELADVFASCSNREEMEAVLYGFLEDKVSGFDENRLKKIEQKWGNKFRELLSKDSKLFEKLKELLSKKREIKNKELESRIQNMVDKKVSEDIDLKSQNIDEYYKQRFEAIKTRIHDQIKLGKDLFMINLKLKPFDSKLKYAEVSGVDADYDVVEKLLDSIEEDLKVVEQEPVPDTGVKPFDFSDKKDGAEVNEDD